MFKRMLLAVLPLAALGPPALPAAPAEVGTPAAQSAAECPVPAPEPCPPEGPCIAVPTVEMKKHTRICYDCKQVEYCRTWCAHIPLLTEACHGCGHHKGCGCAAAPCPECTRCGHVRTRKVLIKRIITEEVPVPACKVEHVAPTCPGVPPCGPVIPPQGVAPAPPPAK